MNDKKLITIKDEKVELTEAGKLLRDALALTGVITIPTGEKVLDKRPE
ncbi:MAG: hypothetical protein FWH37_07205 [Candidatus Bathyarchaeota archaeon]|nr:hypothetical protein [Candidatus Termiticorpusculum sp.]